MVLRTMKPRFPPRGRSALLLILVLVCGRPALAAPGEATEGAPAAPGEAPTRTSRVALFRAPGFPTADAPAIDEGTLAAALEGLDVERFSSPEALASGLDGGAFSVLVLPYGSAFPLEAWPALRRYVGSGGGLVVLGGAPLHQPVRREGTGEEARYVLGPRQPTYAHELLIGPSDVLDAALFEGPMRAIAAPRSEWAGPRPEAKRTYALTVRLATHPDLPGEGGAAGPRDGVVRPLVLVLDKAGVPRQCPLLEIDRLRGDDAGARWVLAPSDARLDAPTIRAIVERALEGAAELVARPVRATVEPGENAILRVTLERPVPRAAEVVPDRARVTVRDDSGTPVFTGTVDLVGPREMRSGLVTVRADKALPPGLYHARVETPDAPWRPRSVTTGFWVRDAALLASGPRLAVSRDWIRRDGKVVPVIGTTYMASDVHRKFLFEPNPHVWDRDFADMSREGINLVRTGLWTAWSRIMLDPGAVDESFLSALDAYVLTAAKNGIPVCFNFYAFLPPAYGDENPYLGPRALEGQRALLTLVASRYRGVSWIHWDLINEPSYAPPSGVWSNLPIGDRHEAEAWRAWVKAKHGDDPLVLRDLWRDGSSDPLGVPRPDEIGYRFLRDERHPRKVRDFFEFTQDVVAAWAARLRGILREAAGSDTLVTLGQDEGGTGTRPAQQILADSLDYTAIHTWWNNDDLLWDGVVTKVPEKPDLHQETGLMSVEDIDGAPWRTPRSAEALLDRKFADAFAARGAGVVEWAWNVNPYQPEDNEATIGFNRPDGTAKPERDVAGRFARFFAEAAPFLDDFEPDPVVLVIPHSRLFAGRPAGVDATKRVVRLLGERYGVVPTALSELRLSAERLRAARLVIVPTPEMVTEDAARALLEASRRGTKVLVTGEVEGDPYGRPTPSLEALGLLAEGWPVTLHEPTGWGVPPGGRAWVTFDSLATQWLKRAPGESVRLDGNVWHEPLPLELAVETEPLVALLGAALEAAGVATNPAPAGVAARLLVAPRGVLAVCVNETPVDARRRMRVEGRAVDIPVPAQRSRLLLFERGTGRVLVATPGEPVTDARRGGP
jgi:hypothetical protein